MLCFDESGQPRNALYGDVYKSRAGAVAEAHTVFIGGTGAAERWRARERFTVLELGFGLGVNFLATLAAWRADPHRSDRLHFVSIEGQLLRADEIARAHLALAVDGDDARRLRSRWPPATPGLHRMEFDAGRVTLTIAIGDVGALLPRLAVAADAFYLDGFAPDRNPAMWSPGVAKGLARLAHPGATLATYSAAGSVHAALAAAGFEIELHPGFAGKRHRLQGRYAPRWRTYPDPPQAPRWPVREAIVVGGGLAGCASAAALMRRGWRVTLLERRAALACEGSGQPAIADHLHVSPDDNPLARLTRAALLLAGSDHDGDAGATAVQRIGKLALADDEADERRQHETVRSLAFPDALLQAVDRDQASDIAGVALRRGGLWMPGCRVARPGRLCEAWVAGATQAPRMLTGVAVARLLHADGLWSAIDAHGRPIAQAPVVVLASAGEACRLAAAPPPLRRVRGQTTMLRAPALAGLRTVIGGAAYACPLPGAGVLVGSTFDDGESLEPDAAADLSNLRRLARMLDAAEPEAWAAAAIATAGSAATGHRYVARDRLPMIGPMPDASACRAQAAAFTRNARLPLPVLPGLFGAFGFGSRGLLWASLAGESIGAALDGEPAVLETDLLGAIDPGRFMRHALRRGRTPG